MGDNSNTGIRAQPFHVGHHGIPTPFQYRRDGVGDALTQITGIGPKLQAALYAVGIFHFDQIAGWTGEEVAWADENVVNFKGRASRDGWVAKASALIDTEVKDDA